MTYSIQIIINITSMTTGRIIVFIVHYSTAPRIPPHQPPRTDKRRGVMSLVGLLLNLLSCLVAKGLGVLSCSLAE